MHLGGVFKSIFDVRGTGVYAHSMQGGMSRGLAGGRANPVYCSTPPVAFVVSRFLSIMFSYVPRSAAPFRGFGSLYTSLSAYQVHHSPILSPLLTIETPLSFFQIVLILFHKSSSLPQTPLCFSRRLTLPSHPLATFRLSLSNIISDMYIYILLDISNPQA